MVRIARAELVQSAISAGYLAIGGMLLWISLRPDASTALAVFGYAAIAAGAVATR